MRSTLTLTVIDEKLVVLELMPDFVKEEDRVKIKRELQLIEEGVTL